MSAVRKTSGRKRHEKVRDGRKPHKEGLHNLCLLPFVYLGSNYEMKKDEFGGM